MNEHISKIWSLQSIDESNDIYATLSASDKEAVQNYKRITIRGKLARGVPVLLHNSMYECIEIILKHRDEAGVHPKNPYIFGLPQDKRIPEAKLVHRHLIATDLIRVFKEMWSY